MFEGTYSVSLLESMLLVNLGTIVSDESPRKIPFFGFQVDLLLSRKVLSYSIC